MLDKIDLSQPTGAIFSEDHRYRYALWRVWKRNKPTILMFVGLNPSIASSTTNDPTITRLMSRAYKSGFGGLLAANLYALVSTDPKALLGNNGNLIGNSVGLETDGYLRQMINMANKVLCAWGSFPPVKYRCKEVLAMIPEPYCLGTNADGQPKHPLYVGYNVPMIKMAKYLIP